MVRNDLRKVKTERVLAVGLQFYTLRGRKLTKSLLRFSVA